MKTLLMLPVLIACAMGEEREDAEKNADLKKLADPATREAEAKRLTDHDGEKTILTRSRFHEAPQKDGAPLRILAAEYDYRSSVELSAQKGEYSIKKPEELFDLAKAPSREPTLSPIEKATLLIFDADGMALDPFDGDDWLRNGYLYDFNRDGILERADVMEENVKNLDWHQIDVFTLRTIEREPRTLLRVLFNWHSERGDEPKSWRATCFDDNGDGIAEIGFGPSRAASDAEQRHFVFRWDAAVQAYSAGVIPAGAHLRVLKADEGLEAIAKEGGLGYDVAKGKEEAPPKQVPRPAAAPYVFRSLRDADDAAMLAFFKGKPHRDRFSGPEDAVPNQAPKDFWNMSPKQAALALAEINRTPVHRYRWKLAIDDRDGIAPPESGWWVYDWDSAGCYTSSSHLFALRFGKEKSWLLATEANSSGVVGANPLADQPGHTARVIPLENVEAGFLAETLFWLDRVRAHPIGGSVEARVSGSSSADGHGSLHLIQDGKPPREIADTVVWVSEVSGNWEKEYSPMICLNLAEYLFDNMLPDRLGERWQVAPEIGHRGASTPLEERLAPRLDDSARRQLAANLREAFARHAADPIPALAISGLVQCVGEEALADLGPDLKRVQAALLAKNAEDKEYEASAARFQFDHFGQAERDDPQKHPKDYARFQRLIEKRQFEAGAMLRQPLETALHKLEIAGNAKRLQKQADANNGLSAWALDRLRKNFPEAWQDFLILRFREQGPEERCNTFETVSTAFPDAGKSMIDLMSPKQVSELLVEIAGFEAKADPERAKERVPALLNLLKERKVGYERRGDAMQVLTSIPLDQAQLQEATTLLLAEIKDPQKYNSPLGLNTLADAVDALSRLPGAAEYLDTLQAANKGGIFGFESGLDLLARLTVGRPDRQERLEGYLKPCLEDHHGMMYEVFFAALAFDLKGLTPGIAAYATENPEVPDGDGSYTSGGNFKGPAGKRYHAAREVAALWSETDPATLARMWIAFAASNAYSIKADQRRDEAVARALREKAAAAIRTMPGEARDECIAKTVAAMPDDWSRKQADGVLKEIVALALAR